MTGNGSLYGGGQLADAGRRPGAVRRVPSREEIREAGDVIRRGGVGAPAGGRQKRRSGQQQQQQRRQRRRRDGHGGTAHLSTDGVRGQASGKDRRVGHQWSYPQPSYRSAVQDRYQWADVTVFLIQNTTCISHMASCINKCEVSTHVHNPRFFPWRPRKTQTAYGFMYKHKCE